MSKVCQLFSGSRGNSIYISSAGGRLLVDAGVSAKRLDAAMAQIDADPNELDGILVTHEHSDHISGLRVFAAKHDLPVYAHPDVLNAMLCNGIIDDKINAIPVTGPFDIKGTRVTPFAQSHDSVACLGYRMDMSDHRSISICTDTGYITPDAHNVMPGSDLVVLESNHEVTMLQNGPRPYSVKRRIMSSKGHLSNYAAAEFAVELVKSGTTRIVLAHISRDNNTPDIARQTTLAALLDNGLEENYDFRLTVSSPINTERPIVL